MPHYSYQSDARAFSQVLEDIGGKDDPKLYLGELVDAFGERGFGALMVFFGLISAVIGAVPGTTTVLGAPVLLIAFQLVVRRDQVWMPKWVLKRHLMRSDYRNAVAKVLKPVRAVERLSRPRLLLMSSEVGEVLIGVACFLLAAVLMLPIPGGNLFPSLLIATFGFGLMQRDGVALLVGWTGTAALVAFVWMAWELVSRLVQPAATWIMGLF